MILTIVVFLLMLSVLVLIHEWGHFFVAKKFGIKVEEFGFGFPPRLFGIKKGETLYSINWIPIGGFVKLYGEDEAGAGRLKIRNSNIETRGSDTDRAFYAKSVKERALVVVAGVFMNLILAIVIFYSYLYISNFTVELPQLPSFGTHQFFFVNQETVSQVLINGISKDSPAEKAGMQPFSKITVIDGHPITKAQYFLDYINSHKGKEVTIVWEDLKTGKKHSVSLVPRVSPPPHEGSVGVSFFSVSTVILRYETLPQKIFSGVVHPMNLLAYNFDILGKLLADSIRTKDASPVSQGVSGPVGIYSLVGTIVQLPDMKEKVLQVLNLAGILSISLAFFNILPIPALDGGRLLFILIEGVTRKKVHPRIEGLAHAIGMAFLLTLIALITAKDLLRVFSGKSPFGP